MKSRTRYSQTGSRAQLKNNLSDWYDIYFLDAGVNMSVSFFLFLG